MPVGADEVDKLAAVPIGSRARHAPDLFSKANATAPLALRLVYSPRATRSISALTRRSTIEPSPDDELTFKAPGIVPLW